MNGKKERKNNENLYEWKQHSLPDPKDMRWSKWFYIRHCSHCNLLRLVLNLPSNFSLCWLFIQSRVYFNWTLKGSEKKPILSNGLCKGGFLNLELFIEWCNNFLTLHNLILVWALLGLFSARDPPCVSCCHIAWHLIRLIIRCLIIIKIKKTFNSWKFSKEC